MCEIHRLTTNTCLTQVLIFKYHKVMNKIPLSGFCLLLKSRHKHLFRIMRITYMLLFAAIFCLHAENAISQKITLQGDNLSVKDYLNTIPKKVLILSCRVIRQRKHLLRLLLSRRKRLRVSLRTIWVNLLLAPM